MSVEDMGMSFNEPSVNTQIEQADKALHPEATGGIMGLIMKSRIEKHLKPLIDHILSRAIQRGKFDILGDGKGASLNAAESMVMADFLTSIAVEGEGRAELIEIVSQIPRPQRMGGRFGGGGSYKEDIQN